MNKYYADSLPARIKTAHAHQARSQALVDDGNEFAVSMLESAKRYLEKLLSEAAEAEIPEELIAEATSYKPVSKLREEIGALRSRADQLGRMLDERDAEVAAYGTVQLRMAEERDGLYAALERTRGIMGAGLTLCLLVLGWTWGAALIQAAGITGSVPFWGLVSAVVVLTAAAMVGLERWIDGGGQ